MNLRVPARARGLRAATIAGGAAVVAAAAVQAPFEATGTLALLLAGVVLAELLQITSEAGDAEEPAFSFSSGVHLATVLLLGPWAAVLVAVFGVLTVDRLRGRPWGKIAFNAGVFALAAVAGGFAFTVSGGTVGSLDLPADFAPIAAGAVAYAVVNTVLVTLMVVFWSGTVVRGALAGSSLSVLASSTAEAALGVLLAVCALVEPWAIAAVVPLVVAAYQAHARHVQLRRETARALETFANVIDERDPNTYRHAARVAELVQELGRGLRLPAAEVARLESAGRLHDLGKIAVDAAVLRKPGRLSGDEWAAMRRHPRLSARLLQRFRFAAGEARAVEYHHERFDGRGYYGIAPDDIPLAAHFLTVADTYDAMRSDRSYRPGLSEETALTEIERNAGTQFHPAVAKAFVAQRRGEDPIKVLTRDEYAALRHLKVRGPGRRRWPAIRPELVAALALALGLGALGLGHLEGAIAGLAAAAAAFGAHQSQVVRGRRLARRLAEALADRVATNSFTAAVAVLEETTALCWAGLVAWRERELTGTVVLASGDPTFAPSETGLTSWLIRDADGGGALVAERRRAGTRVGVRVRGDGSTVGYVVLAFEGGVPRHVELALEGVAAEISHAFAGLAPPEAQPLTAAS